MVVLHDLEPTGQHCSGVAVALTGVLVNDENIRLSRMLERRLTTSRVVVVDTSRFRLRNGVAPRFFSDALLRAGGWPEAKLIVAGANPRLKATLTASGVARDVLLVRDVDDAQTHVDVRPERVACRLYLTGCHTSIHRAVARVASIGHAWGAPGSVVDDARRVMSQLVENAVRHARSVLQLSSDREGLRIAVRDFHREGIGTSGNGLALVSSLTTSWGVIQRSNGKGLGPVVRGMTRDTRSSARSYDGHPARLGLDDLHEHDLNSH